MQGSSIYPHNAVGRRFFLIASFVSLLAAAFIIPSARILAAGRTDPSQAVTFPEPLADPIEPFNRVIWGFNEGLMAGLIKPSSRVYRFVVRKPVRNGIRNFGRNITYPGRLINNLLQGKWAGARDESYRFGCNTVLGLGGFFDVASTFDIPKWEADFGQTFGYWGWQSRCFLMLPVLGPSSERDAVGLIADTAANPLTYLSPYSVELAKPLTYLGPYSYVSYGIIYNNLSDSVDQIVRFSKTEKDPYSELAYGWKFARDTEVSDNGSGEPQDPASLETLQSVFASFMDPEFPNRGATRSVRIPSTGMNLEFSYWLQPERAPVVYIVPGLGSHRLTGAALGLAELLYAHGFSAVCVSSPFNYEFMENASTVALPAYTAIDACDLQAALTQIDADLAKAFPARLGSRALLGYSMGAFHTLFMAAGGCESGSPSVQFDRYVSINSPVRLLYATSKLDAFFQAPAEWPADQRARNIENTVRKVSALTQAQGRPRVPISFNSIESRFLVGAAFRVILRDVIFSSQQRYNQGVLEHPIKRLRREPLYREILQFSFRDYFDKFVVPFYQRSAPGLDINDVLDRSGDLRASTASLQANSNVRLIGNRNDFLLSDSDLEWLETTFAPDRLTLFPSGGHLGNLLHPDMQKAILSALEGL